MLKSRTVLTSLIALCVIASPILSGCTSSRHEKNPAQYAQSSAITFKVKEKLLLDPYVKSAHISVTTYNDTVTLSGYVDNSYQKQRAVQLTRRIKGVEYVVDQLAIKG